MSLSTVLTAEPGLGQAARAAAEIRPAVAHMFQVTALLTLPDPPGRANDRYDSTEALHCSQIVAI